MKFILQPLTAVFRVAVALRHAAYRRGWLKTHRLGRPVISVGNLSVGGTGKTPLVVLIARTLLKLGWRPGILTRGYGRRGRDVTVLRPSIGGADRVVDPRAVGDEPALLAAALPEVPIIVGADRYRGGRFAEEVLKVNVHILDDGFQHLALARDLDMVVLDATQNPLDDALLPAGRLREPITALGRADVVIISRTELACRDDTGLASLAAQINPRVKVFRSATKLCGVKNLFGGETFAPNSWGGMAVQAFCGLGNPKEFFDDLRKWGFTLSSAETFADHHLYTEVELRQLITKARKAGAPALITTVKDTWNFPSHWSPDFPMLVCRIHAEVLEAREFEAMLEERLRTRG